MIKQLDKNMRFAMVFLLAAMAAAALMLVVRLTLGLTVGLGAVSFVVPLVGGMFAGMWGYEDTGKVAATKALWTEAAQFAGVAILVTVLMSGLVIFGPGNSAFLATINPLYAVGGLVMLYVIFVLAIRLGLTLGIRSAMNKG
ncbi:MAG: ABZJ_00895 family protein [Pseudomonadota bacterium]